MYLYAQHNTYYPCYDQIYLSNVIMLKIDLEIMKLVFAWCIELISAELHPLLNKGLP